MMRITEQSQTRTFQLYDPQAVDCGNELRVEFEHNIMENGSGIKTTISWREGDGAQAVHLTSSWYHHSGNRTPSPKTWDERLYDLSLELSTRNRNKLVALILRVHSEMSKPVD